MPSSPCANPIPTLPCLNPAAAAISASRAPRLLDAGRWLTASLSRYQVEINGGIVIRF
jgi:hypothetical protein